MPTSENPRSNHPTGRSQGEKPPAKQDKAPEAPTDAATIKGDVEERAAEEAEQGFIGVKVDPIPNEEYSLETGPDSPPAVEDNRTRVEHYIAPAAGETD